MNRHNQILLNKLVEISQGKQSSIFPKRPHTLSKNASTFDQSFSGISTVKGDQRAGSLNLGLRKRMNEKIEHENHEFAKKLFTNSGAISSKKLEEEYKEQLLYKKNIMRVQKQKPVF